MSFQYILRSIILLPLLTQAIPAPPFGIDPGANAIFDDPSCPDYATCAEVSLVYLDALHTTIANPTAVDRNDGQEPFRQHYNTEPLVPDPKLGAGVRADLTVRGIYLDKVSTWRTFLRDIDTGLDDLIIDYTNLFDTAKGVILAIQNFLPVDGNAGPLTWSELIYQTWKGASDAQTKAAQTFARGKLEPGGPISTLQHVIQSQISEPGTLTVLKTAYENRDYPGANSGDIN
ncbi:MAG: hypothetical protein Q9221_000311 [Calogaya cf. arnoldii]